MPRPSRLAPVCLLLAAMAAGMALVLAEGLPGVPFAAVTTAAEGAAVPAPLEVHLRLTSLPLPAVPVPVRTHAVVTGDTLWTVARDTGVSVEALAAANHLPESALLHPGQTLALPPAGAAPGTGIRREPSVVPAPSAPARHVVAAGDTLWTIARDAGVSVAALAAANGVSERAILRPGEMLRVPAPGSAEARGAAVRATAALRTPPRPAVRGNAGPARGRPRLLWPTRGTVTSRFGWRIHPIFRTREFHAGLDIATRWGSPVRAARAGIVRFMGWMSGYGRMIVLDHGGGLETTYSHLSAALVRVGERVAEGQIIGRIGSTGWSTGPHLFFQVRKNGRPVDPSAYLH